LKWQPIHSRQQLPFFLSLAPFVAFVITERLKSPVLALLPIGLLFISLPWVLFNQMRPLIPIYDVKQLVNSLRGVRSSNVLDPTERYSVFSDKNIQLFHEIEPLREPLELAINHLAESSTCRDFGFLAGDGQIEYPVWKLLSNKFGDNFRFKHVLVANGSEVKQFSHLDFDPCTIISLQSSPPIQFAVGKSVYIQEYINSDAGDGSCCTVGLYNKEKP